MSKYLLGTAHLINRIMPLTGPSFADRRHFADDKATGALGFCPTQADRHLWSDNRTPILRIYSDLRASGLTVKVAGRLATKCWECVQMHPDVAQVVIVSRENGAVSVHPAGSVDLASGFIGGANLTWAMTIDVRNARERLDRAVAADAQIVGEMGDAE